MSATQLIDALIKNHKSARTLAHIQDQNIRQGWYIKSATNKTNSQQRQLPPLAKSVSPS